MKRVIAICCCCGLLNATAQAQPSPRPTAAIKTELRKTSNGFQLYRDGEIYFVRGAGGSGYPARIAAYGGNSIRTWGSHGADKILDTAAKYGLTVLLGLDVARERHGFNYDDTAAVRKQLDKLRQEVIKYKDHPALLAWGIGNELNLQYKNTKVWDAVNEISKMIHELDPNHPTTTVLAGVNKNVVDLLKTKTTDIDLLSVNTYGGLAGLPRTLRESGWEGAYMVTEWGPTGHWEGLETEWKSPIEETSSEKAAVYKSRYEYSVERDRAKCLGSYVFLWGQKQERTPTWYGLFTEQGEESEVIDVMQYLWSGKWPANKAPHLYSLQLDNKKSTDNIYVKPGTSYSAFAVAADPDKDKLSWRWEVMPEPTQLSEGGDFEARPKPIPGLAAAAGDGKATLKTPVKEGAYRLFVYVTDGNNNVATANIPFFVKP
ncbi:glycoside hydrolase family 2 TIM barrel-domain containing protein [Paraflavitalea pollutisoli]|uniref:glycoside hydrolase family 2 TIM barrel-domain containing protein n=1 Tax=Paraflavitalea pollutisoli TaxID=3034143 RepID=UPI0023EBA363|nr:glycoside hydrolase family 2 TIM barrel-domain containing protein [Paraflavitalea sp. H1-2-19X]